MLITVHHPVGALGALVESVTYFAGLDPRHQREKLLPDGAIEIVVDLGESPKHLYETDTGTRATAFRGAWISGMQLRPLIIEAQKGAALVIIRFRPGGAYPFLHIPADTLFGKVEPLESVVRRAAASLRDRLLAASKPGAKIAAVLAWLEDRYDPALRLHPAVAHLRARLAAPNGPSIAQLAEEAGLSQRQLLTLVKRWVGVAPKAFARIARFQAVLLRLEDMGGTHFELAGERLRAVDWAALAAEMGYGDQAHLVHEFNEFAGMSPTRYADAYRGLGQYLPITLTDLGEPAAADFRFRQDGPAPTP